MEAAGIGNVRLAVGITRNLAAAAADEDGVRGKEGKRRTLHVNHFADPLGIDGKDMHSASGRCGCQPSRVLAERNVVKRRGRNASLQRVEMLRVAVVSSARWVAYCCGEKGKRGEMGPEMLVARGRSGKGPREAASRRIGLRAYRDCIREAPGRSHLPSPEVCRTRQTPPSTCWHCGLGSAQLSCWTG